VDPLIWLYLALLAAVAALVLAGMFARQVNAADPGNETMVDLMGAIREGAMTFIRREYTAVAGFVVVLALLIGILLDWGWPWGWIAYIFGAVLSALAGFIGMRIATAANARTAEAARTGGVNAALPLAFRGGAVMGFTVAGLGLLGLSLGYLFFKEMPSGSAVLRSPSSPESAAGSTPKQPTSVPTSSARSRPESLRMIPATRR
jgi:K(+)-stimulated pyrophosphate-energized sodium pump